MADAMRLHFAALIVVRGSIFMVERTLHTDAAVPSAASERNEALAALQLWQTLEYLSPQKPPKPERAPGTCVWALNPNATDDGEMPWKDTAKIEVLAKLFKPKRRYMLFGGVISGKEWVETTRALLGAPPLDFSEQRAPSNTASFVIPIDEHGYVSGEVFVSTVPWAIACIQAATANGGLFDFSGFFGQDGVQQRVKDAVNALLAQRQLIDDVSNADEAVSDDKPDAAHRISENEAQPADETSAERTDVSNRPVDRRTLDVTDVQAIAEVVFDTCGWRPSLHVDWIIQTLKASTKNQEKAADDPLNSFFAEELEQIQGEYLAGRSGKALSQFLETPIHPERCDLESTREHLVHGVHPGVTPEACWPGEYPLVTAQQFAVNAIMRDVRDGGLFSVNGPPGTGKTTMLKDILAAIVLQRADVLVSFDDPKDAFPNTLTVEGHKYPVRKIHDRLRGFGIVVACANNGAAENISKELPGRAAIDPTMGMDYFSEIADSIGLSSEDKQRVPRCWGLVSAALGKQENRFAFATDFWEGRRDSDTPKKSTKKNAPGADHAQPSDAQDPMRPFTLQDWVAEFGNQTPSWSDAKQRYVDAKARAKAALERAGVLANQLSRAEQLAAQLRELRAEQVRLSEKQTSLKQQETAAQTALLDARSRMNRADAVASALRTLQKRRADLKTAQDALTTVQQQIPSVSLSELTDSLSRLQQARNRVKEDLEAHAKTKPGVIDSLFNRGGKRRWVTRHDTLLAELDTKRRQLDAVDQGREGVIRWQRQFADARQTVQTSHDLTQSALTDVQTLEIDGDLSLDDSMAQSKAAKDHSQHSRDALHTLQHEVTHVAQEIQANLEALKAKSEAFARVESVLKDADLLSHHRPAWHLFDGSREDFHRASPYHDESNIFGARRDLFVAAMDLHKAFIVHAWSRLKTALYATIGMLQGKINPNQIHGGSMPLWDTLFLVVPLVSTTFASFPRLFRGIGKEQLAWVLIDEAGQAAPQYCVGALWRAKRAVVVGDPLQLEPVVGVPEELVGPLRKRCGTDPRYVPPRASAQTLADLSNRYGMYLNADSPDDRLWLGSPLIVHRRCISPMFEIANALAYENKMVYGGGKGAIDSMVSSSGWFDVSAQGHEGHWVPEQASYAMELVKTLVGDSLRNNEGKLRAFVISPFKKVAEKMKELLVAEFGRKDGNEMCGTVHTFQGKEADYVVFLLGGDPKKPGAISSYAGKNPNLVNVAVTRAKKRLYVIGHRDYWTGRGDTHGYYRLIADFLDEHGAATKIEGAANNAPTCAMSHTARTVE